jgi:hypothetical protein
MTAKERNKNLEQKITKVFHAHSAFSIDTFNSIPDLVSLINQEVAERMPTEEKLEKEYPTGYAQLCILFEWDYYNLSVFEKDILKQVSDGNKKRISTIIEWFRSRMEEKK